MDEDDKLADYLAGMMAADEREDYEGFLCDDAAALAELIGQRRISAGLHAFLGDGESLIRSITAATRGRPDAVLAKRVLAMPLPQARKPKAQKRAGGWAVAAIAVLGIFAAWMWQGQQPVATLLSAEKVEWQGKAWQPGDALRRGTIQLSSGVAEIRFANEARIAVEGPAEFIVEGKDRVRLTSGVLGAVVPPAARGFTVETPDGRMVDLGTRFGVRAGETGGTETHVFEGRVDVAAKGGPRRVLEGGAALAIESAGSTLRAISSDASLFPQPERMSEELLLDGGFEPETRLDVLELPGVSGVWGGDPTMVLGEFRGVRPHAGKGMLRILSAEPGEPGSPVSSKLAERWQVVDLRSMKEWLARGEATAEASARFTRASSTSDSSDRFILEVLAFRGEPSLAKDLWINRATVAVAQGKAEVRPDDDATSWQAATVTLKLPSDADFLLVSVQARANWNSPDAAAIGRFADAATLRLRIPTRGAVKARR